MPRARCSSYGAPKTEGMVDKRRARQGSVGGNLTPAEAKKKLALPVYAVLAGQAVPIFPGTSLAAPSGLVGIFQKPGYSCRVLPGGKGMTLPVWVNDRQWERAVVPVLTDPRWSGSSTINQFLISTNFTLLVEAIGDALAQSFHEAGYGPLPST